MAHSGPRERRRYGTTGKGGAAAKAGHNLVIEVTRWQASFDDATRSS